jgi:hypothetical protein
MLGQSDIKTPQRYLNIFGPLADRFASLARPAVA